MKEDEESRVKQAEAVKVLLLTKMKALNFHKEQVVKLTKETRTLDDTYRMMTNLTIIGVADKPVVDYVEEILREHKEGLYIDTITALLKERFQVVSARQTVAAALIRAHNAGKRFIRVGKNTFALREQGGKMK